MTDKVLESKECIGKNVLIESYTDDRLVWAFGPEGDNDWWSLGDSKEQKSLVGHVGKIIDWIKCGVDCCFVIVEFSNEKQFTFDINDISVTEDDITLIEKQEKVYTKLTTAEVELAEKLLVARFSSVTGTSIDQELLRAMVLDCTETSIIFHHNVSCKWDKDAIIRQSERFLGNN